MEYDLSKIAILGYGSLIWDLDDLAPRVRGNWHVGKGPKMPVEFSRVSPKRKKALVLMIDEGLSHECATSYIASKRDLLDEAIIDLAARERCRPEFIGYLDRAGRGAHLTPFIQNSVSSWLESASFDAVVWAALPANFEDETGKIFSHENGLAYLQTLEGDALVEARKYISNAPEVTDTPFRRFLGEVGFL